MNLSKHDQLVHDMKLLINVQMQIDGNEGLFGDIFSSVGSSLLNGASWVGGKSADILSAAFKKANNSLLQAFGSHKTKINHLLGLVNETEEDKDIKLSKDLLKKITSNGSKEDIISSLKELIKVMELLDKYRLELESFYQRELSIFQSFKSINNTEDSVSVIKKLDDLVYPKLNFENKNNSMLESNILPGGKVLEFDTASLKYGIHSEEVKVENDEETIDKNDLKDLLKLLNTLEETYKKVAKANESYMDYIKKFNTVVGESFKHLESLKGEVSTTLIRDLESRLEGNPRLFAYYSGFLPKVSIYLDDYVDNISSYFAKHLIN